ncbi:hypothetical protein FFLO_06457 [Filobasidium floriforme]|uniref:Major facilitator superfamily (MFS) profile domain-containing protein n=1 Tax=Filobasidium floriforme TaxID=5210 RepID=A0A8K0JET7_9TREE|nr:hypothetical protein FFLO_06457 [Filobasidium floriforme]
MQNNTASWWFRDAGMRKLSVALLTGWMGSVALGFDNSLTPGLLSNPLFVPALGITDANILGLVLASTLLGGIPGLFLASYTCDRFGRRFNIATACVIIIAGAIVQALTTGGFRLMAGKIVVGFGTSFQSVASGPYVAEIAHPRNRPQVTALVLTFYYAGSVIAAWTTYGTLVNMSGDWSWRLPLLLQAAPSAVILSLVFFIPESPRWLFAKGRADEAHAILAKYHANGQMDDELVLHELSEIRLALEMENSANAVRYRTFLSTKGNKHRLFILIFTGVLAQWVGNGIITNYLPFILVSVGITSPADQTLFNGGLQIWNWIAATGSALACERLGRRFLWLVSATGMLCCFVIITACSAVYAQRGDTGAGKAVLAFLYIYFGFYDCAFTSMTYVYLLEILPYSLRTKGFAIFNLSTYVAAFFNIYVNPIALEKIAWKYYFVFIGMNIVAVIAIYFGYPETKGRILEEVAEIFDGPSAIVDTDPIGASVDPDDEVKGVKEEVEYRERV